MDKVLKLTEGNDEFLKKVEELSGEKINRCNQCGVCSSSCPMTDEMDITPSQVMSLVQLGQKERVLESSTIWVCASCYTCRVRCPRELDLSKVGEALRMFKLRSAVDHIDINSISKDEMKELPQIAIVSAFRKFTG